MWSGTPGHVHVMGRSEGNQHLKCQDFDRIQKHYIANVSSQASYHKILRIIVAA
jgi:hypothetical protein